MGFELRLPESWSLAKRLLGQVGWIWQGRDVFFNANAFLGRRALRALFMLNLSINAPISSTPAKPGYLTVPNRSGINGIVNSSKPFADSSVRTLAELVQQKRPSPTTKVGKQIQSMKCATRFLISPDKAKKPLRYHQTRLACTKYSNADIVNSTKISYQNRLGHSIIRLVFSFNATASRFTPPSTTLSLPFDCAWGLSKYPSKALSTLEEHHQLYSERSMASDEI
eukprot:gene4633-9196_t